MQELFGQFGPIADIVMKGRYAFVEFKSAQDADDAIAKTNGTSFHNYKLVVETPSKSHTQFHSHNFIEPKDDRGARRAGPSAND
jgi:RNA recognition motif-containing protein